MSSETKFKPPQSEPRFSTMAPEWKHQFQPVIKSINSLNLKIRTEFKEKHITKRRKILFDNYFQESVYPKARKMYFDAFESEVYPKLMKKCLDHWVYRGYPMIAELLDSDEEDGEDDFVTIIKAKKKRDAENPITFGLGKLG
jgi:hypothetical protein